MIQALHDGFKNCLPAFVMIALGHAAVVADWSHIDPSFIVDPVASIKAAPLPKSC